MTRIPLPPHQAWTFARLPDVLAAHHITADWVLHIGAHHGEEVAIYRQCGFRAISLVEPDPRNLAVLFQRYGDDPAVTIHRAAVAEHAGTATLHHAARTVWSGLRPHPTACGCTSTVDTVALDTLQRGANVLVIDTQGTELEILAAADLDTLDLVIVETTRRPGDGAALYDDAVAHMRQRGWRVVEEWVHDGSGYTDTLFTPA